MSKRVVAVFLVACLVPSVVFGSGPGGQVVQVPPAGTRPASPALGNWLRASGQEGEGPRLIAGMRPAFFWVGLGLLAEGAGTTLVGAVMECDPYDVDEDVCQSVRGAMLGVGIGSMAAGAIVWGIGKSRAKRLNVSIGPRRGGWLATARFQF